METIVTYFLENVIKNFQRSLESGKNIDEIEQNLQFDLNALGCEMLKNAVTTVNNLLSVEQARKTSWNIERKNQPKTLLTIFGEVQYERTYFKHRTSGKHAYLADLHFGLQPHQRMTSAVESQLLESAIDISYAKSGAKASVSQQTVANTLSRVDKNLLKHTPANHNAVKKRVKTLYVSADEDHVAMQDGTNKHQYLIYVYEGYDENATRKTLKNVRYFTDEQGKSEDLWLEVAGYIEATYETEEIETTFLSGDGARWIKEGLNWLVKPIWVLDKYHLNKYVMRATGEQPDMRFWLWDALNSADFGKFDVAIDSLVMSTESEKYLKRIYELKKYVKNNREGVKNLLNPLFGGCSAEGHISHILSARLSSRPLGWSVDGANKIANMRAFRANGGNICDVVRAQKNLQNSLQIKQISCKIKRKMSEHAAFDWVGTKIPEIACGKKSQLRTQLLCILNIA